MLYYLPLYNKVNQLYVYVHPFLLSLPLTPPPTIPPLWVITGTRLSSLCYIEASL